MAMENEFPDPSYVPRVDPDPDADSDAGVMSTSLAESSAKPEEEKKESDRSPEKTTKHRKIDSWVNTPAVAYRLRPGKEDFTYESGTRRNVPKLIVRKCLRLRHRPEVKARLKYFEKEVLAEDEEKIKRIQSKERNRSENRGSKPYTSFTVWLMNHSTLVIVLYECLSLWLDKEVAKLGAKWEEPALINIVTVMDYMTYISENDNWINNGRGAGN